LQTEARKTMKAAPLALLVLLLGASVLMLAVPAIPKAHASPTVVECSNGAYQGYWGSGYSPSATLASLGGSTLNYCHFANSVLYVMAIICMAADNTPPYYTPGEGCTITDVSDSVTHAQWTLAGRFPTGSLNFGEVNVFYTITSANMLAAYPSSIIDSTGNATVYNERTEVYAAFGNVTSVSSVSFLGSSTSTTGSNMSFSASVPSGSIVFGAGDGWSAAPFGSEGQWSVASFMAQPSGSFGAQYNHMTVSNLNGGWCPAFSGICALAGTWFINSGATHTYSIWSYPSGGSGTGFGAVDFIVNGGGGGGGTYTSTTTITTTSTSCCVTSTTTTTITTIHTFSGSQLGYWIVPLIFILLPAGLFLGFALIAKMGGKYAFIMFIVGCEFGCLLGLLANVVPLTALIIFSIMVAVILYRSV